MDSKKVHQAFPPSAGLARHHALGVTALQEPRRDFLRGYGFWSCTEAEMTQTKRKKTDYIIQSVDHALDVLEAFHSEEDELGITELSRRLKLHKNNIFRILATLESRGYIEQNLSLIHISEPTRRTPIS